MSLGEGAALAGRYRLRSKVGHGGMGTVWAAHDEFLDRDVAVKEVRYPPGLSESEQQVLYARTLREARSAARLSHPGIVTVHDVVEEDGRPWIVMALVRARSLQEIIDKDGPLPGRRVAEVGLQVLAALRVAHRAGVLHRDVKPSNVLLQDDSDAHAVLTDFGIATMEGDATLTQTGLVMGSPAYIAPERARGEKATRAADLWALGATLYAACEGRPPHYRTDAMAALSAVLTEDPPPPRNAGSLAPLFAGLLVKDPAARTSADAAFAELSRAVHSGAEPSGAEPTRGQAGAEVTIQDGGVPTPQQTWPTAAYTGTPPGQPLPPPLPSAPRKRGKLIGLLVGAAVLVAGAAVAGIVLAVSSSGSPKVTSHTSKPVQGGLVPQPGTKSTPKPSSPPRTTAPPTSAPPLPGFETSPGPGSSSIMVPTGWQRTAQTANRVKWTDPATNAFMEVDTTGWESPDPVQHWRLFEQSARAQNALPDLQEINLTGAFNWRGWNTADLEFTWTSSALGPLHGYDRGFTVNGQEYVLFVAAPSGTWDSIGPRHDQIFGTFQP